ncbi:hypothetical protein E0H75_31900 [Kribbella capetownensis]|uniref:Uncharacterized protein n=1 Tax=Kribbella capetownensis TaxID=1572659 RepID=A0A4R0JHH0_9ACTN|nr:hypothetical protein [Kribbella capetownensis]TCC45114.1 hypothetical protein E0H75_31900 [Kribbella capetownensis]
MSVTEARTVLAAWLAQHSVSPDTWTPEALQGWHTSHAEEWTVFTPPGNVNRLFLVANGIVFSFAPSELSLASAVLAAREESRR